jgi:hypothetical protein
MVFPTILTTLIGKEVLNKINIVVSNGADSQEIGQLEDDVTNHFLNVVYCICCSRHIIDHGWKKKVKTSFGGLSRKKHPLHLRGKLRQKAPPLTELNKIAQTIYTWLFLWAHPSFCESKEEYLC